MEIRNDIKSVVVKEYNTAESNSTEKEKDVDAYAASHIKSNIEKNDTKTFKAKEGTLETKTLIDKRVRLDVEDELHIVVAKIIDKETGDVLKQIPPEEIIKISKAIKEQVEENKNGLIIDMEA